MASMAQTVICGSMTVKPTRGPVAKQPVALKSAFTGTRAAFRPTRSVRSTGLRTETTCALMNVAVLSADGSEIYYANDVEQADLPTPSGRMCILPNHQALMTPLQAGTINLKTAEENVEITTSENGFARQETSGVAPDEFEGMEAAEGGMLRILLVDAEFKKA
eukprot:CAMPEP_0197846718 /NCGR_PEP_ID=MMETSP1438-20131217/4115_1 /TAXON_ID=1461541 /ORGANISM="Pterosperma sp., Strain CCMP1384" /LENGTH=162 /DNA_ID=CAMNT_0043458461 /DNA_START=72 /DNA_END=560 /DNA_ORIENTATION=+